MALSPRSRRFLMVNTAIVAVIILASVFAHRTVWAGATSSKAQGIDITVSYGTVSSTETASGSLAAATTDDVGFGTSGTIQTLDIKSGQTVKAGQIIGTVDAENAQLTLESDQANLDQATQALALAESGNETAVQITQDNLQVDQLDASITSAKTALATADTNLADAETACADGTASTTSATVAGTTSTTEESTGSSSGTSGSPSEASNSGVGTTCADESADASAVFCDHR